MPPDSHVHTLSSIPNRLHSESLAASSEPSECNPVMFCYILITVDFILFKVRVYTTIHLKLEDLYLMQRVCSGLFGGAALSVHDSFCLCSVSLSVSVSSKCQYVDISAIFHQIGLKFGMMTL